MANSRSQKKTQLGKNPKKKKEEEKPKSQKLVECLREKQPN